MPDSNGTTRVSIPRGTSISMVTDEDLIAHSFDLLHFPSYLARKVAPRVRVEITEDRRGDPDLVGCFEDDHQTRSWKYASLVAKETGCLTDSDDFYRVVHAAFDAHACGLKYIGFARCGRPPDSPLFATALMYSRYGRGIYLAGQMLPTPCPELTAHMSFTLR